MRVVRIAFMLIFAGLAAQADQREDYLDMARRGWSYELRTTMIGRDMEIPVRINGRDMAGAALCVVGEKPHAETRAVLDAFRGLIGDVYGKPLPMRFAGDTAQGCGAGRVVLLRLYSGRPPNRALSADVEWMNSAFGLGLPRGRDYAAMSPAMAQTFFGHLGQVTHIMVKQPGPSSPGNLERKFYRSILVEELYQSFTFGMDVLKFDRKAQFVSKLQEFPVNMGRMPWSSRGFMRAILGSNPVGLCRFDVFMLHAVAQSPGAQTNSAEFIDFIDANYERLDALGAESFADARFAPLMDPDCAADRTVR
ncbi:MULTISPECIES: hypothetical protein [unclassified Roseovarius]|uniref:hypothetical protein n=1 Tax=unclassified Roseovarius TaxID=2614913 RepID=UPI00273D0FD4|nr:hypothetical protein [Roseovarius sp. MMSF_3350]